MAETKFPCGQCGAKLEFSPGTTVLECPYCGSKTPIVTEAVSIEELDYHAALRSAGEGADSQEAVLVACGACGAKYTRDANITSDRCPYCDSPQVKEGGSHKMIKPRSLLPFKITREEGQKRFRGWIGGLWFAPNALKRNARSDGHLNGMYTPYWTYDCRTDTRYTGERGEYYYVTETYTTIENGESVRREREVRKTRWHNTSGRVDNTFDDVLVLASETLPRKNTLELAPWDLENLVPYTDDFLSGFRAEAYQLDLEGGFEKARGIMSGTIRSTISRDIGGDDQRIHSTNTDYHNITFKHILLPVWISAYRYQDKVFRFLINGRTGEVQGERPWSYWKIAFLVLGILFAVGTIVVCMGGFGVCAGGAGG